MREWSLVESVKRGPDVHFGHGNPLDVRLVMDIPMYQRGTTTPSIVTSPPIRPIRASATSPIFDGLTSTLTVSPLATDWELSKNLR